MKIKSYFSKSVEKAIQQARDEMGSDAVLITSRRASNEAGQLGDYEVVFGLMNEPGVAAEETVSGDALSREIRLLREQFMEIRRRVGGILGEGKNDPERESVLNLLLDRDLDPDLAVDVLGVADERVKTIDGGARPPNALHKAVVTELAGRLKVDGIVDGATADSGKLIVFVGPSGGGKTTALTKLAVQLCLGEKQNTLVVSLDTHRAFGHQMLSKFADLIGIPFVAADTVAELHSALDGRPQKSFVLIDTPGFAAGERDEAAEAAQALALYKDRQTHLVLPATINRRAALAAGAFYQRFSPSCLLLTKTDEAYSLGTAVSTALKLKLPLSYLSTGTRIPEDWAIPAPGAIAGELAGVVKSAKRETAA